MNKPHKHAELIKAWADGAKIEVFNRRFNTWSSSSTPVWSPDRVYRIKPTPREFMLFENHRGVLVGGAKLPLTASGAGLYDKTLQRGGKTIIVREVVDE